MGIQEIQQYVTLIKDVLTALAAVSAACIGFLGLATWRKQLRGRQNMSWQGACL